MVPAYDLARDYQENHWGTWKRWCRRGRWYVVYRLVYEVGELVGAVIGLHNDDPEHELLQIASICMNWIDHGTDPEVHQRMDDLDTLLADSDSQPQPRG